MAARKRRASPSRAKQPAYRSRVTKSSAELERIENLLGENFETLTEARHALQAETGPRSGKHSYTVTELSHKKHRTIKTFIADLEENKAEIDALKKPPEFWAAQIYGNGTWGLYTDIGSLARKLGTYRGLQEDHPQKALKNIKIVRVTGAEADKYLRHKREVAEASWKRRRKKGHEDRQRRQSQTRGIRRLIKNLGTLPRTKERGLLIRQAKALLKV